jgi:hypothetical protein
MVGTILLAVLATVGVYALLCVVVGPVPWPVMLLPVAWWLRLQWREWRAKSDRDALVKHLRGRL